MYQKPSHKSERAVVTAVTARILVSPINQTTTNKDGRNLPAAGLLVTTDHLWRLAVRCEPRAHLLDLRRLLVSALANLGNCSLEVSLLLSHGRLQLRNRRLLLLHFALFFEKCLLL